MKLFIVIPLLIATALVGYFAGQFNVPWRYHSERLQRNPIADLPHTEIRRVTSPDGAIDAILALVETDSLSANGLTVYLGSTGKKLDLQSIEFDRNVFYANRIDGLELVWREAKFLEIRYSRGDIHSFRNNWWPPLAKSREERVEIRIVPQNESYSLSKIAY